MGLCSIGTSFEVPIAIYKVSSLQRKTKTIFSGLSCHLLHYYNLYTRSRATRQAAVSRLLRCSFLDCFPNMYTYKG